MGEAAVDTLGRLLAAQLNEDAAAKSGLRHLAAAHADRLRAEGRKQLGCLLVAADAADHALAAGMAGIDDRAQASLEVVAGKHRVELVDRERRLPELDRAVQGRLADLYRGDAARHQERDEA